MALNAQEKYEIEKVLKAQIYTSQQFLKAQKEIFDETFAELKKINARFDDSDKHYAGCMKKLEDQIFDLKLQIKKLRNSTVIHWLKFIFSSSYRINARINASN